MQIWIERDMYQSFGSAAHTLLKCVNVVDTSQQIASRCFIAHKGRPRTLSMCWYPKCWDVIQCHTGHEKWCKIRTERLQPLVVVQGDITCNTDVYFVYLKGSKGIIIYTYSIMHICICMYMRIRFWISIHWDTYV